jgi:hypothetical protein
VPTTDKAKEHGFQSHVANEPLNTDKATSERRPSGEDMFTISDAMHAEIVQAGEVPTSTMVPLGTRLPDGTLATGGQCSDGGQYRWIRDPGWWGKRVPGDRIQEFARERPGGRPIKIAGEFVRCGDDLILAYIPAQTVEVQRKGELQTEQHLLREMSADRREDDFDPKDEKTLRDQARRNADAFRRAGLVGDHSPTSGMSYREAREMMERRGVNIDAEERYYANPTRHVDYTDEQATEILAQESARSQSGGKMYSLPQTVRPRNLAKT